MHTLNAKDGTIFNFNIDFSGDVRIRPPGASKAHVSGNALLELFEEFLRRRMVGVIEDAGRVDLMTITALWNLIRAQEKL